MFIQRQPDMLEVIKVTGDMNVSRGEYSFCTPWLELWHRICDEDEFRGARAVQGFGQIANTFFYQPQWIPVESISPQRSD
jgi:Cyclin D1 binding domain